MSNRQAHDHYNAAVIFLSVRASGLTVKITGWPESAPLHLIVEVNSLWQCSRAGLSRCPGTLRVRHLGVRLFRGLLVAAICHSLWLAPGAGACGRKARLTR